MTRSVRYLNIKTNAATQAPVKDIQTELTKIFSQITVEAKAIKKQKQRLYSTYAKYVFAQ